MTGRPRRVLDLFCGAGGAGYGYYLAGCEVTGVDIEYQPGYPFDFKQADAMTYPLEGYDLIHASPPCQQYSAASAPYRKQGREYPDLIAPVRERLISSGIPYVIENVERAPLDRPVMLCGTMFGLPLYRHRLFECSFPVPQPAHPEHLWNADKTRWEQERGHIVPAMRIDRRDDISERAMDGTAWMTMKERKQAIPPAFTRYIAESGGSRPCVVCGRWFSPVRSTRKACSNACRQAAYRNRQRYGKAALA